MSLSLREQLLQAGFQTGRQRTAQRAAEQAAAEKTAKEAEIQRRKQEKAERRARFARIRQLVGQHQVPRVETEDYYNFQDGPNVRRVAVTPELRGQLVRGELAIVRCEGRYAFVPAAVGAQVRGEVERALVHCNDPATPPAADDPYREFAVPDDLVW